MVLLESILDDEITVKSNDSAIGDLTTNQTVDGDSLPMRMMFRVGFGTTQIYNSELEKVDIRAFIERLSEILDHCCFMEVWTMKCEVLAVEGANFPVEEFEFPLDRPGVRSLADGLDLQSLLKRIPTLALDFKFITSFDIPQEKPSY